MRHTSATDGAVVFRLSGPGLTGTPTVVVPAGAAIGRHHRATLHLHHPSTPWMAGVVARRGRRFFFEPAQQRLVPGAVLSVGATTLTVTEVRLPAHVLAIQVGELPPQELIAAVHSVRVRPRPDVIPSQSDDADAVLTDMGPHRVLRVRGQSPVVVRPGLSWMVRGVPLTIVQEAVERSVLHTSQAPVRIWAGPATTESSPAVRIQRPHRHRVSLEGPPAALLHHLAHASNHRLPAAALPTQWARQLDDLADTLRAHGVRPDLVRDDGLGGLELYLAPRDQLHLQARASAG